MTVKSGARAARRAVQAGSTLLLIVIIWNTRYPLESFINPKIYFQLDPLVMVLTSIAQRVLLPGLAAAAAVLALSFAFGRWFCGWICPMGGLLDAWNLLRARALRLFRRAPREGEPGRLRYLKFVVLAPLVLLALSGVQAAWTLDPITIFVRAFSYTIHPAVNGAIDLVFQKLILATDGNAVIEGAYNSLREGFLSIDTPRFPHSPAIFAVFAALLVLALARRRFWCRYLCPLGAVLALTAAKTPFRRRVGRCREKCSLCRSRCRMNAIRGDGSYIPSECILCLDCIVDCPEQDSTFSFSGKPEGAATAPDGGGLSRKAFLGMCAASAAAASIPPPLSALEHAAAAPPAGDGPVRPPGALPEREFVQRCIRCGNCMKVCPTNVLQPAPLSGGLEGLWAPRLDPVLGFCQYGCTLCGQVCPTEAIRRLTEDEKNRTVIGIAVFDKKICIPWAKGENCIVCEEHCPVPDKAIILEEKTIRGRKVKLPSVDPKLCIGCAICENKCPTRPARAVRVKVLKNAPAVSVVPPRT